jgi:hypothetical protein
MDDLRLKYGIEYCDNQYENFTKTQPIQKSFCLEDILK